MTFVFQPPHYESGPYAAWGRANAPSGTADSFWVSDEFDGPVRWNIKNTATDGWRWSLVTNAETRTTQLFRRPNHLYVGKREDGTKLDRILVTNDPGFSPHDP